MCACISGKRYGLEAHQADENDFEALKWAAIMTGQSTDYLGTKERIEEGGKFKVPFSDLRKTAP